MKPLLSILVGFTVALGLVGTGVAGTVLFLSVGPVQQADAHQNVAQLWSAEPRRIDAGAQDLERLPSVAHDASLTVGADSVPIVEAPPASEVDDFTTAAIPDEPRPDAPDAAASPYVDDLAASHIAWCADRYRSYRIEDDSYTPYSGGRRLCVSPWSEELDAAREDDLAYPPATSDAPAREVSASVMQAGYDAGPHAAAGTETAMLGDMHVEDCFSRYRSYRPEDNTYQPFGGGPRRQCE